MAAASDEDIPYDPTKLLKDCPSNLLVELANTVSDGSTANCRRLAGELGFKYHDVQVFQNTATVNHTLLGEEMLKAWQRRDGSTVYQLEVALNAIGRHDCVKKIRDILTGKKPSVEQYKDFLSKTHI